MVHNLTAAEIRGWEVETLLPLKALWGCMQVSLEAISGLQDARRWVETHPEGASVPRVDGSTSIDLVRQAPCSLMSGLKKSTFSQSYCQEAKLAPPKGRESPGDD